jgi:hypothetical protein
VACGAGIRHCSLTSLRSGPRCTPAGRRSPAASDFTFNLVSISDYDGSELAGFSWQQQISTMVNWLGCLTECPVLAHTSRVQYNTENVLHWPASESHHQPAAARVPQGFNLSELKPSPNGLGSARAWLMSRVSCHLIKQSDSRNQCQAACTAGAIMQGVIRIHHHDDSV